MALQAFYKRLYWFGICAVMVLKWALVGWWPLLARMYEKTDSVLFVREAIALLEGDWLGPYNYMTLMKGPMTPFWIASTNYLGWPVNFARETLYLSACLLALKALSLVCRSKWVLFLFFSFIVLFPAGSAYGPLAALFRESIHMPLVLGIQSLLILVFVKHVKSEQIHVYEVVLLGMFLLAFFLNREESPWIFPQLAWFATGIVVLSWWRHRRLGRPVLKLELLKVFLVPALIVILGIEWVSNRNFKEYGVDAIVEINRPEFKLAYKGLMSIKPEVPVDSATLTIDMRQKLFDLPLGTKLDVEPLASGRQPAMFVPWNFRAATQNAGYYDQGGAAVLKFYDSLGEELESACANNLYECRPVLFGVMPLFDGFWAQVYAGMVSNIGDIMKLDGITPNIKWFPSYTDYNYKRNLSLLTSAPIALTPEDREALPKYYTKMEKKKTSVLEDILAFYMKAWPVLGVLSVVIFVCAIVRSVFTRRAGMLEFLMLGMFGALCTQLLVYSLLWASGLSFSSRLYFNTYPVFVLFIFLSLIYLWSAFFEKRQS